MALHPKIAEVLVRIARTQRPEFHQLSPQEARAAYEAGAQILDVPPMPLHRVDNFTLPARDGYAVPVRLYRPRETSWVEPQPILLYYHGGGFTVGSLNTHDAICRMLAKEVDCLVLAVDYRLAPEYPFPTAVFDAFDALQWLHEHAAEIGADAARIAVGGDSAGGTLAAVVAIMARDAKLPLALQFLLYPGTSARQDTASHLRLAQGYLISRETIFWFFEHYLQDDFHRDDWRFSPLDGGGTGADVQGVAPAWIAVAEYDPLHDEGVLYAEKLKASGVPTECVVYEGMIHDFFKMRRFVADVGNAHADAVAALRKAFGTENA